VQSALQKTASLKNGCRKESTNYRPISLLPIISKIFEKLMANQIINFVTEHNIIHTNQYGFLKNRSTEDAVTHLTESVIEQLDNKLKCLTIFLDLSKAFDSVNHTLLLKKIKALGFSA